jgi:hypothetical protein
MKAPVREERHSGDIRGAARSISYDNRRGSSRLSRPRKSGMKLFGSMQT